MASWEGTAWNSGCGEDWSQSSQATRSPPASLSLTGAGWLQSHGLWAPGNTAGASTAAAVAASGGRRWGPSTPAQARSHRRHGTNNSVLRPGVWQLIYWPCWGNDGKVSAGAGRAEYVRIIFEEAGEPYEEVEDATFVRDFFWKRAEELQPLPVLAPPAIHRDGFVLAQTAAIARYLARKLHLLPSGGLEEEARADQIVETVHELVAEARIAFHPDYTHKKSYWQQQEAAVPYIRAFERSRFPRFLEHLERLLVDAGGEYFVGASLSYVDLQVFTALRVAESQFPGAYAALPISGLRAFSRRIASRPRVAAYLASDRCRPFAGDSFM
eukprot:gnl/TRDRNA2_/TRDRNA2_168901_c0_seq2.p1 gnl/TRDRNA2_/TRDRNA2_168901_c0~~gnl/TRDRNA2_/TRDRNA2_168901_c0_seq2.p1  ORF type:complete len:350 (-),score=46.76 gnl/TRDRNA2_/TRDRNA2_168901_c0_seq2:34-1014(-)